MPILAHKGPKGLFCYCDHFSWIAQTNIKVWTGPRYIYLFQAIFIQIGGYVFLFNRFESDPSEVCSVHMESANEKPAIRNLCPRLLCIRAFLYSEHPTNQCTPCAQAQLVSLVSTKCQYWVTTEEDTGSSLRWSRPRSLAGHHPSSDLWPRS